jgi:hypothetical protein
LPWADNTIYAAMSARERQQLRKAAPEPVPSVAAGKEITPAA